jgi:hypothetical protein
LAKRCAEIGAPEITRAVIANIETGRRKDGKRRREVTVDETLTLAYALDVPPALLIAPLNGSDELAITPDVGMDSMTAAAWLTAHDAAAAIDRLMRAAGKSQWRQSSRPFNLLYSAWLTMMIIYILQVPGYAQEVGLAEEWDLPEDTKVRMLNESFVGLAENLDGLTELGLIPPPVPAAWISLMRARKLLRYPDVVLEAAETGGTDPRFAYVPPSESED